MQKFRESGPLKYLWSFQFESKHQQLKAYAKVITVALKFSLKFAAQIFKKKQYI